MGRLARAAIPAVRESPPAAVQNYSPLRLGAGSIDVPNALEQHCGPSYSSTACDDVVIATWFFQQ
jgi:hypothetical protein